MNLKQRLKKEMIQTLIDTGYPVAEIAIVFGITRPAMYNWIAKMQIKLKNLTKNKTGV